MAVTVRHMARPGHLRAPLRSGRRHVVRQV